MWFPLAESSQHCTISTDWCHFLASLHQAKILGFYCDRRNPQAICITPLYSIDLCVIAGTYVLNVTLATWWLMITLPESDSNQLPPINPIIKFLLWLSTHHVTKFNILLLAFQITKWLCHIWLTGLKHMCLLVPLDLLIPTTWFFLRL